jgi:hypothetical protein
MACLRTRRYPDTDYANGFLSASMRAMTAPSTACAPAATGTPHTTPSIGADGRYVSPRPHEPPVVDLLNR